MKRKWTGGTFRTSDTVSGDWVVSVYNDIRQGRPYLEEDMATQEEEHRINLLIQKLEGMRIFKEYKKQIIFRLLWDYSAVDLSELLSALFAAWRGKAIGDPKMMTIEDPSDLEGLPPGTYTVTGRAEEELKRQVPGHLEFIGHQLPDQERMGHWSNFHSQYHPGTWEGCRQCQKTPGVPVLPEPDMQLMDTTGGGSTSRSTSPEAPIKEEEE